MTRSQGFLIMPAREFDGGLRLGGVNHRQVVASVPLWGRVIALRNAVSAERTPL
jgi:hypothetical protein